MRSATAFKTYRNKLGLSIRLPDQIFEAIQKEVRRYYPHECGGIFVGRIENNTAVIEKVMTPMRIISSPMIFKRVASFLNKCLVKVFNQSNGQTLYLGEWHSHPDGRPLPSHKDFIAMKRIAFSESVRIQTPILLIIGWSNDTANEMFYVFHGDKLVTYEKEK